MPSPFTLRYKLGLSQRDTNTAVRDAERSNSEILELLQFQHSTAAREPLTMPRPKQNYAAMNCANCAEDASHCLGKSTRLLERACACAPLARVILSCLADR